MTTWTKSISSFRLWKLKCSVCHSFIVQFRCRRPSVCQSFNVTRATDCESTDRSVDDNNKIGNQQYFFMHRHHNPELARWRWRWTDQGTKEKEGSRCHGRFIRCWSGGRNEKRNLKELDQKKTPPRKRKTSPATTTQALTAHHSTTNQCIIALQEFHFFHV
jgi:hypothetical protein